MLKLTTLRIVRSSLDYQNQLGSHSQCYALRDFIKICISFLLIVWTFYKSTVLEFWTINVNILHQ